jgi:hypothetical protein
MVVATRRKLLLKVYLATHQLGGCTLLGVDAFKQSALQALPVDSRGGIVELGVRLIHEYLVSRPPILRRVFLYFVHGGAMVVVGTELLVSGDARLHREAFRHLLRELLRVTGPAIILSNVALLALLVDVG